MNKSFLKKCAERYGSPLYVYDLNKLDKTFNDLKKSLPKKSKILYSIKANPNSEIIKKFKELNCEFEVSSIGEAKKVLACGVIAKKIFLTGPAKDFNDLKFAIKKQFGTISIESFTEISLLKKIINKKKINTNLILRVNLEKQNLHSSIQMMSTPSQFGIDASQLLKNIKFFKNLKNINLKGFHFYSASNVEDEKEIIKMFESCISYSKKLSQALDIDIKVLDLGGGFACNHGKLRNNISYFKVKSALEKKMEQHFLPSQIKNIDLFFESGRFLVGTCGGLITKVVDKKISKSEKFVILNSGINHLSGMTGIGRLQRLRPDYQILNLKKTTRKEKVNIVGPLCTPLDFWNKSFYSIKFEIGDYIYVPNVSSYGLTASLVMFLSHEMPKELIIDKSKILKIMNTKIVN